MKAIKCCTLLCHNSCVSSLYTLLLYFVETISKIGISYSESFATMVGIFLDLRRVFPYFEFVSMALPALTSFACKSKDTSD